jgi:hypothetical protein
LAIGTFLKMAPEVVFPAVPARRLLNHSNYLTAANPGSGLGQAPGSSKFKWFWMPAFAGMTEKAVFQSAQSVSGRRFIHFH